jgi:hypothetical protein
MVVAVGDDQHLSPGLRITHISGLDARFLGTVTPVLCIVSISSHSCSMQSECGGNMLQLPRNPLKRNNNLGSTASASRFYTHKLASVIFTQNLCCDRVGLALLLKIAGASVVHILTQSSPTGLCFFFAADHQPRRARHDAVPALQTIPGGA